MSANDFFKEKLAKLLGMPIEEITDLFLKEYSSKHKKKLGRFDSSRGGGHIAARFLRHVDEEEFGRLSKENDEFIKKQYYLKSMRRIKNRGKRVL